MSFDRIAPYYRSLEAIAFGNQLQKARIAFLDQIASPQRALIAGEGNGRFLCAFMRGHSSTDVDCVDASARMLQLARERLRNIAARVRFLHHDLLTWSPEEKTRAGRNSECGLASRGFFYSAGSAAKIPCRRIALGDAPIFSRDCWNQCATINRSFAVVSSTWISAHGTTAIAVRSAEVRNLATRSVVAVPLCQGVLECGPEHGDRAPWL